MEGLKKCLSCYKEAYRNYEMEQNKIGMTNTLRNIGKSMHGLEKLDSAYFYLDRAFVFAKNENLESQMAYILSSMGSIYAEKGLYEKALAYQKESLNYSRIQNTKSSCYYAIGESYVNIQKLDSALLYVDSALMSKDLYVKCSANWLLYTICLKNAGL